MSASFSDHLRSSVWNKIGRSSGGVVRLPPSGSSQWTTDHPRGSRFPMPPLSRVASACSFADELAPMRKSAGGKRQEYDRAVETRKIDRRLQRCAHVHAAGVIGAVRRRGHVENSGDVAPPGGSAAQKQRQRHFAKEERLYDLLCASEFRAITRPPPAGALT